MQRLQTLPANDGFRFVGVLRDGTHESCMVATVPAYGRVHYRAHALDGTEIEADLIGWLPQS